MGYYDDDYFDDCAYYDQDDLREYEDQLAWEDAQADARDDLSWDADEDRRLEDGSDDLSWGADEDRRLEDQGDNH